MLRRITTLLAIAAVITPAVVARANEWEEDYSDEWRDESPPPDDYPVSVDVDAAVSVDFDTFHGALSPYGEWVVAGSYGRVWRPHVAAGWRPYFYGRWEWTNEGWLWVSDEPWGWAAYHYGRWAHDPYYSWVWVPGYQWAPAWVSWRFSGDVVGWAPLAPGVSVYVSVTPFVDTWWTFVPCNSFVAVPVYRVAYAPTYSRRFFYATAPAPARPGVRSAPGRPVAAPVWGGPPRRAIEQRIGRPVTPVRVVAAPSPGAARVRPGEVAIYRPEVRGNAGAPRSAPGAFQRPEVRGPRSAEPVPGAPSGRPDVRTGPGPRGVERPNASTPAPAVRGDDGRAVPRTSPGPGPAAPEGARNRGERAWTPHAVTPSPRSELRGTPTPARPDFHGAPTPARPEIRATPAPGRPQLQGEGSASPRTEFRGPPPAAAQPRAQGGGGRGAVEAPGRGERRR